MSNLGLLLEDPRSNVLKLKWLLDTLRDRIKALFSPNATVGDIANRFGMEWTTTRRFWQDKTSGGQKFIEAVRAQGVGTEICDEILSLMDKVVDSNKSLLPFSVPAIELTFDLVEAFARASNQVGVPRSEQMSVQQFAAFFVQHQEFVRATLMKNRQVLVSYNVKLEEEIRLVLAVIDWSKVRPLIPATIQSGQPSKTVQRLRKLVAMLQSRYGSANALAEALETRQDTLNNALAGNGRAAVTDQILEKAEALLDAPASDPAEQASPPKVIAVASEANSEMPALSDPRGFVGSWISSLQAIVEMGESAKIPTERVTDGQRNRIIEVITDILKLTGIDAATLHRMQTNTGGSLSDSANADAVIAALLGGK